MDAIKENLLPHSLTSSPQPTSQSLVWLSMTVQSGLKSTFLQLTLSSKVTTFISFAPLDFKILITPFSVMAESTTSSKIKTFLFLIDIDSKP